MEHLECTDQPADALVQARYLQAFLADKFGDDYLDLLEEAPHVEEIVEELQKISVGVRAGTERDFRIS